MTCEAHPAPLEEANPEWSVHSLLDDCRSRGDVWRTSSRRRRVSGGGDAGGAEGGDASVRSPQSVQSVPGSHRAYSAPGPPSSQLPSFIKVEPIARQLSVHASKQLPLSYEASAM